MLFFFIDGTKLLRPHLLFLHEVVEVDSFPCDVDIKAVDSVNKDQHFKPINNKEMI